MRSFHSAQCCVTFSVSHLAQAVKEMSISLLPYVYVTSDIGASQDVLELVVSFA